MTTQDVGHCKNCDFQWVIGDASVYSNKQGNRSDKNLPSLQCPFCKSSEITIKKEFVET